ncbi:MAG: hypothetical protein AAGF12_32550 [Myxococcota bacterium]
MAFRVFLSLVGPLLVTSMMSSASAQRSNEPTDADRARHLFEDGRNALERGRFAQAIERLEESLELYSNPSTAFNLAVAYRGATQSLESVDLLERLLAEEFGELPEDRQAEVQAMRNETQLEVSGLEVRTDARNTHVELDGRAVDEARIAVVERTEDGDLLQIELNAGEHVLALNAEGRRTVRRSLDLALGETRRLEVTLPEASLSEVSTSVFQSPWFWTVVGVVLVGATVGGILLFGETIADPASDSTYGVIVALR